MESVINMFNIVKRNIPIITLALLSPVTAELLSGSSPPIEFFNPITLVFLVGLYGSGVFVVRELSLKWNRGWGGIVLLGLAYGIIEEGLGVKSFFDPGWMDLGILGTYGRWLGVNWGWSVCLTIFHAVYSIALPILLFDLLFSSLKNKRLLSDKGLRVCFAILILITAICYLFLTPYRPDPLPYIAALIIVICLFIAVWRFKITQISAWNVEPLLKPVWFGAAGGAFCFLFFLIMYAGPYIVSFPLIPILLEILLTLSVLFFIVKYSGRTKNSYHKLAFAGGLLSFMILIAFVLEIRGVLGMSIVGIFFIVFLFCLGKRIKRDIGKYTS